MECTSSHSPECAGAPTWTGVIRTTGAPTARSIPVAYCDPCRADRIAHIDGSDGVELILEHLPPPPAPKLESEVHRAFRVEYMDGTSYFKVTHTDCGGVVLRTQSVSVETLVLLPVLHAPDCPGYDFTKLV